MGREEEVEDEQEPEGEDLGSDVGFPSLFALEIFFRELFQVC